MGGRCAEEPERNERRSRTVIDKDTPIGVSLLFSGIRFVEHLSIGSVGADLVSARMKMLRIRRWFRQIRNILPPGAHKVVEEVIYGDVL